MGHWEYKVILHKLLTRVPNEIVSSDLELSALLNSYVLFGPEFVVVMNQSYRRETDPSRSVWTLCCQLFPHDTNGTDERAVIRDSAVVLKNDFCPCQRSAGSTTSVDATLRIRNRPGSLPVL